MSDQKQNMKSTKQTKEQKAALRRSLLFFAVAAVITAGTYFGASALGKSASDTPAWVYKLLLALYSCVPVLAVVINRFRSKQDIGKITGTPVREIQQSMIERRENAYEAAEQSETKIRTLRQDASINAVMLVLTGIVIPFCAARLGLFAPFSFILMIYAAACCAAGLSRIRFPVPTDYLQDKNVYVSRSDFPRLYELAEQTARNMGCEGEVHIAIMPDGNVGITEVDGNISLLLGAVMLGVLSEDEFGSILRHEFSHIISNKNNKTLKYAKWLYAGMITSGVLGFLNDLFFSHFDISCAFEIELYRFGLSVLDEEKADRAMTGTFSAGTAASALIKTYYYERHLYEDGTYDTECDLAPETPMPDMVSRAIALFKQRTEEQRELWKSLIPRQILSRSASHPTLKMRLDALGVADYTDLPKTGCPEYLSECDRAAEFADRAVQSGISTEEYAELRKANYLDNIELLKKWEADGRPLVPEGYRDILQALRALGRHTEAEALADRAIVGLPTAAGMFARFIKGSILAHRYDRAAIPLLYEAVEDSRNYREEGLEFIGTLCCLIGDEAELERYREKALEYGQLEMDEYSKLDGIKASDELSAETELDKAELDGVLAFIAEKDTEKKVREIYVVRKTVTERTHTTAVILRFEGKRDEELMHSVFCYLDAVSSWQYSLYDFSEVPGRRIESISGALVYKKKKD